MNSHIPLTRSLIAEGLMAPERSNRREVRNPVTALAGAQALATLPADVRAVIVAALDSLAKDAAERAEKSWRTHKGPMAAYWKATSVYAKHFRAFVRKGVAS